MPNKYPDCDGTPGHFFSTGCVACTVAAISTKTLDQVTDWWLQGIVSRDVLNGYRHVWAISAPRSKAYDHWMSYPDTEEAREIASLLVKAIPGGRGYC